VIVDLQMQMDRTDGGPTRRDFLFQ